MGAIQGGIPSVPVKSTAKPRYCERWGCLSQASLAKLSSVFASSSLERELSWVSLDYNFLQRIIKSCCLVIWHK